MTELALYLGLNPTHYRAERKLIHCPLIKIIPKPLSDPLIKRALDRFESFTHVVITSKSTVEILSNFLLHRGKSMNQWGNKFTLAVGQATGKRLLDCGITPSCIAKEETAEGVVEEIKKMDLKEASFFWPHSFRARAVIKDFFEKEGINYTACPFYDTEVQIPDPLPHLNDFKEIIFTSPSTVDAFLKIYGTFPPHLLLTPIGPVTSKYLQAHTNSSQNMITS